MKTALRYVLIGLPLYAILLIGTAPAHLASRYLPATVYYQQLEGSVWRGMAANVMVDKLALGDVRWRTNPLPLLWGRVSLKLATQRPELQGKARVSLRKNQGVTIKGLQLRGDITALSPYLEAYTVNLSGTLSADIDTLDVGEDGIQDIAGTILLNQARLTAPLTLALGDVKAELDHPQEKAELQLSNSGGDLLLKGKIDLDKGWQYQTNLRLEPTARTPADVRNGLQLLGRVDRRGGVTLKQRGRLKR